MNTRNTYRQPRTNVANKARHWKEVEAAYIDTLFTRDVTYRIHTVQDDGITGHELLVRQLPDEDVVPNRDVVGGRFNVNWRLQEYNGPETILRAATRGILQITGFPPQDKYPEGDPKIRPYPDVLFLRGTAEATTGGGTVHLGTVLGLTLIDVNQHVEHPIWP